MAARLLDSLWVSGYGSSAASGNVRFYQPKSLVPVTVYSDDAASVPITQPVGLDATGRTVVPVYVTAPVRAIIQSSTGSTLEDIERIDGDLPALIAIPNANWPVAQSLDDVLNELATSFNGKDGKVAVTGTGAVQRNLTAKLSETISVKDFGAVGNGITNDISAINSAILAVVAAGGGTVFFPAGTYIISSPIIIPAGNGISIKGTGSRSSIISTSSTTAHIIQPASGNAGYSIEDIGLTAATSTTGAAIAIDAAVSVSINRVRTSNVKYGVFASDGGAVSPGSIRITLCDLGTTSAGISRAISLNGTGGSAYQGTIIYGNTLLDPLALPFGDFTSTALEIVGFVQGVTVLGNFVLGATGFLFSAWTGLAVSMVANQINTNVVTKFSYTGGSVINTGYQFANNNDGSTTDLTTGQTGTPNLANGTEIRFRGTTTGAAYIIAAPTPISGPPRGFQWFLHLFNNAGGAVTGWTMNATYHLSAAISTVDGNHTMLTMHWDPEASCHREVARSVTT